MNIEDYNTGTQDERDIDSRYTSLSNELVFEPIDNNYIHNDQILLRNIKEKISKNISNRSRFLLFLQTIYLNTYLFTKSVEISPFIKKELHIAATDYSYTYDLSIIMFLTYALNSISYLHSTNLYNSNQLYKNKKYILFYCFTTIISGIGFALLGEEISFLRDFTISGDFWKYISVNEIVVFTIIGVPTTFITLRELWIMIKERTLRYLFFVYGSILSLFILNLVCLNLNSAKNIHYNIHHAIFAGVMSVIFNRWNNNFNILIHAIYMGVLIEGISFYGLQELYIFICNNYILANYSISFAFTFICLFLWIIFALFFYNKLYY